MRYQVYTDGACSGNTRNGGWAAVMVFDYKNEVANGEPVVETITGSSQNTTNQRMELTALLQGIRMAAEKSVCAFDEIKVYTDSAYCCNCYKDKWYKAWVRNGWVNSKGEPVKNRDLWELIVPWFEDVKVEIIKVKGHSDNLYNNLADQLAVEAKKELD